MAARRRSSSSRSRRSGSSRSRSRSRSTSNRQSASVMRVRLKPGESRDMRALRRRFEGLANASGKTIIVMSGGREIGRATPDR
jgi:hypothetical protein